MWVGENNYGRFCQYLGTSGCKDTPISRVKMMQSFLQYIALTVVKTQSWHGGAARKGRGPAWSAWHFFHFLFFHFFVTSSHFHALCHILLYVCIIWHHRIHCTKWAIIVPLKNILEKIAKNIKKDVDNLGLSWYT